MTVNNTTKEGTGTMLSDVLLTNFFAIVLLVVILLLLYRVTFGPKQLPPGPIPWPVIGNLMVLRGDVVKAIQNLRHKYGDVYRLYLGNYLVAFVHGYKNVKEILVTRGDEFADRPHLFAFDLVEGQGIASASGQIWKEQRRFTLHTLKYFGFGKSSLESKVLEEVEVLVQCLADRKGAVFCIEKLIHTSVANVICSIVFGKRFMHDDPKFKEYMETIEENLANAGFVGALNFMPWLRFVPGDPLSYHTVVKNMQFVDKFIRGQIEYHKKTTDPENPRDFIDAYLAEMKRVQNEPSTTFQDSQMLKVIGDLFVAGTETTSTTLVWALLFLINNQDVQLKLRTEIHSVVGKSRLPSLGDRKNMPYTEATLMEIQRCADIAPMNVPHAAIEDTTLNGYNIPKGTCVIPVLSTLLNDPDLWKNPDKFDPNRFLDKEGQVIKQEELIPFSAGKRVCLGESLARMELFLFLTSMLQKFVFQAPEGVTSIPVKGTVGITHSPERYSLRAIFDQ